MWKMFDETMIECVECGGGFILEPPPKFMIPPPPRPPSMGASSISNCNEEEMALKAQQAWDSDMCEAIPILDASLYSSQSLQTSAMIAVFSLLLVLVVLISSLFVWKNKRKMQNFLPCKTPTRGPHINGGLPIGSGHSVTYEDPDAHLGHRRPLVMRHHHNVEMLHGKSIHYPSGYPMTRSPPFLVSSSPGPDPYRSNDNVYEELGPGRDSDGESEPPLHSDDDFAEDELSLPGERSFNKTNVNEVTSATLPTAVSTIYHERVAAAAAATAATNGGTSAASAANGHERNSVLSSSSSSTATQDASTATAASTSSSHNNNSNNVTVAAAAAAASSSNNDTSRNSKAGAGGGGLLSGMLRHTTGRSKFHTTNGLRGTKAEQRANAAVDDFNTSSSTATDAADLAPIQQLYDNRSNLMSLAYVPHQQHPHQLQQQQQQQHQQQHHMHMHPQAMTTPYHHSLHHISNNNNNIRSTAPQFYNTLESEVERRNRINAQLSHAPAVATIFRERINYPGSCRYPQPYYTSNSGNGLLASSMRARTNPRSMDRRHRIAAPIDPPIEPAYGYSEPVYRENYHYETCGGTPTAAATRLAYPAYIVPDYISAGSYRTTPMHAQHQHQQQHQQYHPHHQQQQQQHQHHPATSTYQNSTQLYSRGDSSFGSDSGYSHHTPASSIGRHDYDVASLQPQMLPPPPAPAAPAKATSKLSAALSFGWNRRKTNANTAAPTSLNVTATQKQQATAVVPVSMAEATSPNNNSASSTVTSMLENSSSTSSSGTSAVSTASSTSAMAASVSPAIVSLLQNNNATAQA